VVLVPNRDAHRGRHCYVGRAETKNVASGLQEDWSVGKRSMEDTVGTSNDMLDGRRHKKKAMVRCTPTGIKPGQ